MSNDGRQSDPKERRTFLAWLAVAAGGLAAAVAAVPVVGFVVAPVVGRPRGVWRTVGPLEQFQKGQTVRIAFRDENARDWSGQTSETGAWLRREPDGKLTVFALDCTHLGCPVRWEASAELFMCPCHGGVYYGDGRVAGGPPPRPLSHYPVRVRGGQVEVRSEPLPIT